MVMNCGTFSFATLIFCGLTSRRYKNRPMQLFQNWNNWCTFFLACKVGPNCLVLSFKILFSELLNCVLLLKSNILPWQFVCAFCPSSLSGSTSLATLKPKLYILPGRYSYFLLSVFILVLHLKIHLMFEIEFWC
jgi:hypothetical protein